MGKDLDIVDPLQNKEFPLLIQMTWSYVFIDSKAYSKRMSSYWQDFLNLNSRVSSHLWNTNFLLVHMHFQSMLVMWIFSLLYVHLDFNSP